MTEKINKIAAGLVILLMLQSLFVLHEARQLDQTRDDVRRLEIKVANLLTTHDTTSHNDADASTQLPPTSKEQGPLAHFLAQVVILEHSRALALDASQTRRLSSSLAAYREAAARRRAVWLSADGMLTAPQMQYIKAHQSQVDNKTQELLTLRADDARLVDMLADLTHAGPRGQ